MKQDLSIYTGQSKKELKHQGPWLDVNEPQVIFFQGKRKAGKGVGIDELIDEMYSAGITILHLWAARNNENWYYALTKHCKQFWDNWREEHQEELEAEEITEPLHCNCTRGIPISVMIEEGVAKDLKIEEIERFNGDFWETREEYEKAWNEGKLVDYIPDAPWVDITQVKKPEILRGKNKSKYPMIKIKPFTIPSPKTKSSQEKFWRQFTEIVLEARKERRIVVMNPMMFTGGGKFNTIAYILNNLYKLTAKHFPPLNPEDVGKTTRKEMTNLEKSYHKLAVVLGEIKTLSPSSKMNPETGAGESKRSLYNMIGEARHWQCWLLSDYQSIDDLFVGVKYQSDVYVIKRATAKLLGDDWGHLFTMIEIERQKIFDSMGGLNAKSLYVADLKWPEIPHLPDNKGYVVIDDEIKKLETFTGGRWHHKHTKEQFTKDFGVTIPDSILEQNTSSDGKSEDSDQKDEGSGKSDRQLQQEIYPDIDHYFEKQHKTYPEIRELLIADYARFPDKKRLMEMWEPRSMGQAYRRWKKSQKPKE